jgi:hypothetical protein
MTASGSKRGARLMPSAGVRVLFGGVSIMWVERRLDDDPTFPKPIYIAGKRFWEVEELEGWIAAQPRTPPAFLAAAGEAGKAAAAAGRASKAAKRAEQPPAKPTGRKPRSPKPPLAAE